ncbi:MAG: hypothetical protein ACI837_002605 [Crocinitomicaceae bacterium]|jgi:hypothetical protein
MGLIKRIQNKLIRLKTNLVSEPEWVAVYQSPEEYTVHIKKLILDEADIPYRILDQRDSSYLAFGYVYLHVPKEMAEKAEQLLAAHE